jgi:hypothetical protein
MDAGARPSRVALLNCLSRSGSATGRSEGVPKGVKILKEYGAAQALDFSLRLAVENLN